MRKLILLMLGSAIFLTGCAPALLDSVIRGDINNVRALLDKGANVNVRDNKGDTPLMGAVKNGQTEIVKILLDKGADINAQGYVTKFSWQSYDGSNSDSGVVGGLTPLMVAAMEGRVDITKILLEKKPDINIKDANGNTALKLAEKNNHSEIVKLLKEAGAKE